MMKEEDSGNFIKKIFKFFILLFVIFKFVFIFFFIVACATSAEIDGLLTAGPKLHKPKRLRS